LVGDSCTDRYHYGACERLSPEAPVPVFKVLKTEKRGGMVLNVKSNLEGLGLSVDLITNEKEIVKARYIDNRTRQHMIRIDLGEEFKSRPLADKVLDDIDFGLYDCIIISDYDKGFITPSVVKKILQCNHDRPIFVDTKKKDLSCYEGCILKINEKENANVMKFPLDYDLVVTLGESGARYKNKVYSTRKVEIFDVCGAGDTFLAALAAANMLTQDMKRSIKFANYCGSVVVQKFGTYAIKQEDINDICL
tara:strand:- start:1997 stop:2746 length:750 start_codon:yes stop_codon:yes gene_type:complete